MRSALGEAALAYWELGLHPIPCMPKSKRPLVQWRPFQDQAPTREMVEGWWKDGPLCNIALVLGRGLFAVDLDGGPDAEALLHDRGIVLPSSAPRSKTASGYHVFLAADEPIPDSVGLLTGPTGGKPQVDIRGVGVVIAPPSIHPSGVPYEWEVPFVACDMVPRAPEGLLELIRQRRTPTTQPAGPKAGESWAIEALRGVGEGQRDAMCTRLAGYFLHRGLDAEMVEALLVGTFAANCQPPFPASDVRKCVRSIARREQVDGKEQAVMAQPLAAVLDALMESMKAGPPAAVPVPFPTLERMLCGGFQAGELILLGARPGVGKTALALEFARCAARRDTSVLIISREMTNVALSRRMLAQDAHVNASRIRRTDFTEADRWAIKESLGRLRGLPIWLCDQAVSLAQINALVAATTALGLLIVDYLQLVRAPAEIKERRHQVEAVSAGLKTLALQYRVPVLVLSSLSRPSDKSDRTPPTLASLRESGQLEHDADTILLLHRPYDTEETECIVAKNRDGRLGKINLYFRSEFVSFLEAEHQSEVA